MVPGYTEGRVVVIQIVAVADEETSFSGIVVGFVIGAEQLCAMTGGIAAAFPVVVPSAPGNVAKKSSKLRFSSIAITTCRIGFFAPAKPSRGIGSSGGAPVETALQATVQAASVQSAIQSAAGCARICSYSVSTGRYDGFWWRKYDREKLEGMA